MDSTIISEIKRTRCHCKHLFSSSHVFFFKITNGQNRFLKPVTLWLPVPGFSRKRPKTGKNLDKNKTNISSPSLQRPSSTALPISFCYSSKSKVAYIFLIIFVKTLSLAIFYSRACMLNVKGKSFFSIQLIG